MDALIAKIKNKKELSGIPDKYIATLLAPYYTKNKTISSKDEKMLLKIIRNQLRKTTGRYHTKSGTEHVSTAERTFFYPQLDEKIAALHPKSILDVGCGQNPLFQARKGIFYYAYDLNEKDLARVQAHFTHEQIAGIIKTTDITQETSFPKVDLVLAYKILDIIDTKGHPKATQVLRALDTKHLLASFPTISLSGKKMKTTHRLWFEQALRTNGYTFETFASSNELFYLARRGANKVTSTSRN
ncbi:hypothetical protein EXS73_03530 [Candidatus Pacearchaeota archaeon]|nr:hypothetical protein [Candidatus Pacearchaeota archaeon]